MVGRRRVTLSDQRQGIGAGAAFSVVFHLVIALLAIFGLPNLISPPPEVEEPMVVELATLGEKTTPPPPQIESPKPDETPPTPPKAEQTQEQPAPEPPKPEPPKPEPPKPAPPPPPPPPEPDPIPIPSPKPPEPPKEVKQPDPLKQITPPAKKPPPPDDFDSLLKSVDKLRAAAKPPPAPVPTRPVAAAAKTINTPPTDLSSQPTTSERDYVAAQIWPNWNVDFGAKNAATLQIRVKIVVQPDGHVISAVLDGNYSGDSFLQAAAEAAVRAVMRASPLKVPPTRPDLFRNNPTMTINFDPRNLH